MEHPGLVAMGQPLTLIKPLEETRRRKESYTNILAHELTHYWFGDYVTMAWWDDTWLNEALGEWLDATITDQTEPGWKFLDRRPDRAGWAMSTDEQLSTKAMRQPVDTKEAIQGSFDNAITYMKGQTVLSMFESFVGPEKWRDFIRSYVRTFAWKNASADDFLDSMSASLGPRIADAFRTFLRQPGVPLIEHRLKCEGTPYLELHQKRALPVGTVESEARAWDVPVCVRYGAKGDADGARRSCVLLTGAHGNLPLDGACPSWVLMNAGGVGYYRSRYGKGELATLIGKDAQAKTTTAERGTLLKDVDAAVARDQLGIADAMAMVPAVLADPDERIRRQAAVLFNKLDPNVLDDDTYARYQRWILATFGPTARDLGWRRREGDSDERQELRADVLPLVARAGDKPLRSEAERAARAWLSDPSALEDDVVDSVLWTAARNGDAALFNQLLAQARVEKDRVRQQRLLGALGGFLDETLVMRALDLVFDKSFDVRETVAIVYFVAYTRETHDLAFRYVEQNVDKLLGAMRNDEASWFIGGFSSAFCDERHRKEVAALFSPTGRGDRGRGVHAQPGPGDGAAVHRHAGPHRAGRDPVPGRVLGGRIRMGAHERPRGPRSGEAGSIRGAAAEARAALAVDPRDEPGRADDRRRPVDHRGQGLPRGRAAGLRRAVPLPPAPPASAARAADLRDLARDPAKRHRLLPGAAPRRHREPRTAAALPRSRRSMPRRGR